MRAQPLRWLTLVVAGAAIVLTFQRADVAGQRSVPSGVSASPERLMRITQLVERRIAAKDIPGAVTLVAHKGRIVHHEARGVMAMGSNTPMTKETLFALASMTKPVTAVAILMMAEQGRLRLNDPVSRFIPEFKNPQVAAGNGTVKADRELTLRDLLTHTSGMTGPISWPEPATTTLAAYVPTMGSRPLEFQPGTRWNYSNTAAFDTLARVVEIASGQTYDRFLRDRILGPLGMTVTAHRLDAAHTGRLATRYDVTPQGLRQRESPDTTTYFSGSSGLKSTAEEYLRFGQMLLNKGELNGVRIVSPRAIELLASAHIPDTLLGRQPGEGFGLGVRVVTNAAARGSFLSNGSFGWSGAAGTHFWVDPREEIVAILMVQAPAENLRPDFETAVMQAFVTDSAVGSRGTR